jgi:hypothetical protein
MKTQSVQPKFLCLGEVALRLRLRPDVMRRKIRRGDIPAIRLGTGRRAPLRVPTAERDRRSSCCAPAGSAALEEREFSSSFFRQEAAVTPRQ